MIKEIEKRMKNMKKTLDKSVKVIVGKNQIVKIIKGSLFRLERGIFYMCKNIRIIGRLSDDTDILFNRLVINQG